MSLHLSINQRFFGVSFHHHTKRIMSKKVFGLCSLTRLPFTCNFTGHSVLTTSLSWNCIFGENFAGGRCQWCYENFTVTLRKKNAVGLTWPSTCTPPSNDFQFHFPILFSSNHSFKLQFHFQTLIKPSSCLWESLDAK